MKKTIVLDMDSTMTHLQKTWFPLYNAQFDDDLKEEDVVTWNVHQYCKHGKKVYQVLNMEGLFRNLEPFPYVSEVVTRLHVDYNIKIATAVSFEHEKQEKIEWIQEHLPVIPLDKVYFTGNENKNHVKGDVLFDDAPHNLKAYPNLTIALRYPYNQGCADIYVNDWLEFEQVIRKIFPI